MTTTRPPPLAPNGVRFTHRTLYAAASHVGHVRGNNEDVWRADAAAHLYAVADGMGGHDAGEVAAEKCLDVLFRELESVTATTALTSFLASPSLRARQLVQDELRRAVRAANHVVREEGRRTKTDRGIGCTLDAVLLLGDRAFVIHVGDGRVYLARAAATIQLTQDHDLRALLAAEGRLTPSQRGSIHNQLLNAIGTSDEVVVDCTVVTLLAGDRLVLCSDGVHEMIGDEAAIAKLAKAGSPSDAAHGLVQAALGRGGRDNATALVVAILESTTAGKSPATGTRDLRTARGCPLFTELPEALFVRALSVGVEAELDADKAIARIVTTDHVAYIVLEGEAELRNLSLGPGAVLYPESLLGMGRGHPRFRSVTPMRVLRFRADDFREVCATDTRLAAALYERLARHMASLPR